MITQYTRLIVNNSTGDIQHVTSQDMPFADGWEPVAYDSTTHSAYDCEVESDFEDVDNTFGIDQPMLRAREILENFEVVQGQARVKSGSKIADKVASISPKKEITSTVVIAEMKAFIRGAVTEADLLDSMRELKPTIPDSLDKMRDLQVVRTFKAVRSAL